MLQGLTGHGRAGSAGSGPGEPPPDRHWGSRAEWITYWALERLGQREGLDFTYQAAYAGGRLELGGAVVDFYFPALGLGINPQGLHWHYERGASTLAYDKQQAAHLAKFGVRLVWIDDDALEADPSGQGAILLVRDALQGIDHSRLARGF